MQSTLVQDIIQDPLGVAMRAYFEHGDDTPVKVFINGKKDADMYPSLFFRSYAQMKGYERLALKMAKGSVLDVGSAAGCHSLILQKRGLDVTAVEISPIAAAIAAQRGVKQVLNDNIFQVKGIPFNTILLLMNGLGMGGSEEGTLKLLKHLKKMLVRKGMIIGDSTDILYNTMNVSGAFESGDDYHGKVKFQLVYKKIEANPFDWIYLDPALLSELADKAGLSCTIVHRDANFHYLAKLMAL